MSNVAVAFIDLLGGVLAISTIGIIAAIKSRATIKPSMHTRSNPFCAAHPDLSSHAPSTAQTDR